MAVEKNEYYIRAVEEKDIDRLFDIEALCFSVPMTKENMRAVLFGETGCAFVCFDTKNAEKAVGYGGMLCVADEAQILNIATHPDFRHRGIGRLVTQTLLGEAERRGARYVTLEVRESNHAAKELYKSFGFYEVGRLRNYYKRPVEDGLIMKLNTEA